MNSHMFTLGVQVPYLWVKQFGSNNLIELVILCAVVFVACFLRTCLACLHHMYLRTTINKSKNRQSKSLCLRITLHTAATVTKLVDVSLGYLLMLAFMLGNLWICLTIILGSAISYFFTFWSRVPLRRVRASQHRDEVAGEAEEEELRTFLANPPDSDIQPLQPSARTKIEPRYTRPEPQFLTAEERKSMEASVLLDGNSMSTFQRNPQFDSLERYDNGDDRSTLPLRPDIISDQASGPSSPEVSVGASGGAAYHPFPRQDLDLDTTTKDRSDSNPLLDKYPVLRFHNVDVPDGDVPPANRTSTALEFDELDKLIKDLQQS